MFIDKILKLSDNGKEVTVIVSYDDFNPFKKLRSEIDEDQHFLFNHLRNQFARTKNITLEFVNVWDVLELLPQLTADNVNIFIFDFTFNDRSAESKMAEYVQSFSLPEVKVLELIKISQSLRNLSIQSFSSHLWVSGKDVQLFELPVCSSENLARDSSHKTSEGESKCS